MTDLTFRPLRPDEDAALVHGWVTQPRGRFWGMADKSVEEVRDIYAFVDSPEAHWAWMRDAGQVGAYREFRGRDARIEPLLERRGLTD